MSLTFDSHNESELGGFVESVMGAREHPTGRVLIHWSTDPIFSTPSDSPALLASLYNGLHITTDVYPDWTGNLFDYRLVIGKISNATFSAFLNAHLSDSWRGRIHYTAEHDALEEIVDAANLLAVRSSVRLVDSDEGRGAIGAEGPTSGAVLVNGQPTLRFSSSSKVELVNGVDGNILSWINDERLVPWIMATSISGVSWVVAGDAQHIFDERVLGAGTVQHNKQFLENLYFSSLP